ncbi:MAG: hypothetical protein ACK4F9_05730 [Brevinematia bacterium]
MEDTITIIISTIAFLLVLLNNLTLVVIGLSISIIMSIFLLSSKKITIVTKVTTLILLSVTIILGILWIIKDNI